MLMYYRLYYNTRRAVKLIEYYKSFINKPIAWR